MQTKISKFEDAKKLVGKNLPTIFSELDKGGPLRDALITMNEGNFDTIIKWANSAFDPKKTWFESCRELYHQRRGFDAEGAFFYEICDYVQPHWKSCTPPSIHVVLSSLWENVEERILHEMESGGMDVCSGKHIQDFLSTRLGSTYVLQHESSGSLKNNKEILKQIGLKTPSTFSELFIEKTKLKKMNESISLLFSADGFAVISSAADQVRSGQYYPPRDPRYQPPPTPPPVEKALSTSDIDQEFDKTILGIINNLDWKDVKELF